MDGLTYSQRGDYLLPDLALAEPQTEGMEAPGKYGMMRKGFLMRHRRILYDSLLLEEKLYPHLMETERTASSRIAAAMAALLRMYPPPDKARDHLAWAAHMDSLLLEAEGAALREVVFS